MCTPGELIFSEDFDPATVSERWGFKADFALRDGALLRTTVNPTESKRVFLKDPSFHNTIIQFDFKLSGKTKDLRLVTGSGGGYNSVTQIHTGHFQINTPIDRDAGIVPAHLGDCIRKSRSNQWQTMTVEYWDDEILSHLSDNEFVLGKHPIIDRTRRYFAFQFDLPGGSIDNIRVWKATGQRDDWAETRKKLAVIQANRAPINRNPAERYKVEYTNLKSRLTLHDQAYRDLVATHEKLKAALHANYPAAFSTQKQLSKLIAKQKLHIQETNPDFNTRNVAVIKASKAEDAYVLSTKPELAKLKNDGIARQRYVSEFGQVRATLEAAKDKRLAALVAETAERQADLEARFPEAFESAEAAVAKRNAIRKSLNDNSDFQARNSAVVDAGKAIKAYEEQAAPNLTQLAAEAKAYTNSLKSSGAK
ncbi:MAG: hypothetical protein COA78_29275 [Blastopirellula sp.]|nr:MAG: hypothetical protein COA78_29275 [Blastopirellula sp.]